MIHTLLMSITPQSIPLLVAIGIRADVHDLRQQCLSLHHDTPYAGHLGRDRTAHLVQQTYWWPGLDSDARQFVSTCEFCQKSKTSHQKPAGLLQPLTIPEFR